MAKLIVVIRDGTGHEIEGDTGLTAMKNIRAAGFDERLALCGYRLSRPCRRPH